MLLRSILPFKRPTRTERWALRDIGFRIDPGEKVGILGHNGAGKTTLLRLLAGVSQPSSGRVTIRGRVAPLIGIGVGFHHEMSGRENVYVNGMLLGLTKAEVAARFDAIVAFAELEEFIDTPVKFYSSGMFMRLGFSVAIHVDPQVLLVDEVLAVGDLAFQLKCFDRMRELKESGTTIVIVSHSMHAIRFLCPRALLLRHGRLELDADVETVIGRHHELLSLGEGPNEHGHRAEQAEAGSVTLLSSELRNSAGDQANQLARGVPASVHARVRFNAPVDSPLVHLTVLTEDGTVAYEMRSEINRRHRKLKAGTESDVDIDFTPHVAGGTFRFILTITSVDNRTVLYRDQQGLLAYVTPALGSSGVADMQATICLDGDLLNDYPELT
jgi:lipopolysaccharide transport system ATP-binding protein